MRVPGGKNSGKELWLEVRELPERKGQRKAWFSWRGVEKADTIKTNVDMGDSESLGKHKFRNSFVEILYLRKPQVTITVRHLWKLC